MGKAQQEFGLYSRQNFTEQQRLKDPAMVRYWNQVTLEQLAYVLKPGTILVDAGAGPNISLGSELAERGVKYIPFDILPNHIKARRDTLSTSHEKDKLAHVANVRKPALPPDFADVFLMRFVLEHISVAHWKGIITRSMLHTRGSIVIMMHDWSTLTSSTHPEFIAEFRRQSDHFAYLAGIEFYPSKKLASTTINTSVEGWKQDHILQRLYTVSRPEGMYGDEFMLLTRAQANMSRSLFSNKNLGRYFENAATFVDRSEKTSTPVRFQPPSIVFAILQRGLGNG